MGVIIQKTESEIKLMREANRIIAVILDEIADKIKPGVSTYELDEWAEERILSLNAKPGFKGYGSKTNRFPATLCTSINYQVVHGVPSRDVILEEGDIIGIDVGSIYKGYYGDGAKTYAVGRIKESRQALMDVCEASLYEGIKVAKVGNRVSDISKAVDRAVRKHGYEIVRDLSGHGIGRNLHEDPQVINYDNGKKGPKLKKNMTIAIEPMITDGGYEIETLDDGWTIITSDRSDSAHFEHTIVITDNGPEILTRL
jgi:methionyl aminopeptidase